ncbi:hypothetical protein [Mesorhizobium sp. B2-3-15]|uniref:hypothetical protein n=1 Tax=Mesorhizobium sp. B2-3-15 TaxID=2589949 RepID=UPI00112D7693|nr:hypothetical protein [Mesorhizobium sp. B2-3-15]TPL72294.1 hypothetical protein FJ954_16500 [Mesorhizobium sp. B2-3-15]
MSYPVEVMLIINPPLDYASWDEKLQANRAHSVVRFHDQLSRYNKAGNVKWAWGSYPLFSAFNARINLSSFVVVFSAKDMEEYKTFMAECPLSDNSVFITIPLVSLADDFEEDERTRESLRKFHSDKASTAEINRVRASYLKPPSYFDEKTVAPINPPNVHTNFSDSSEAGVSYLLYGVGPEGSAHWSDLKRAIYSEKVFWWYAYAGDLIKRGKITHGWSVSPFCDVISVRQNCKGGVVILNAMDMNELTELYRFNPLFDEAEFLSISLRCIARQREADILLAKKFSKASSAKGKRS